MERKFFSKTWKKRQYRCFIKLVFQVFLLIISVIGTSFRIGTAAAATIYANSSTGDDTTGDGTSGLPYRTFHKAYTMVNNGDTINLTGTFTWIDAGETGDAPTTGYTITKNITIQGQGADTTIIQAATADNTADRRVFTISLANTVTINNVTVRFGKLTETSQDGGGLEILGIAYINSCDISYNRANNGSGGGVDVRGTLSIQNSTIHHNVASYMGGGLNRSYYSGSGGTPSSSDVLDIINCTVSNNQVTQTLAYLEGGGVYYRRGVGSITNSTIAYNQVVNGQASTHGVGTGDASVVVQLKNNIIAANIQSGIWQGDIGHRSSGSQGTYNDNGGNIIGRLGYYSQGYSASTTTWIDQTSSSGAMDGTYVLQDGSGNSGPLNLSSSLALNSSTNGTMTFEITSGSIAINNGASGTNGSIAVPTTDQRGFGRVGTTDIGAYEYGVSSSVTLTVTKAGTGSGTVTATGINCGADCTETYNFSTSVTLKATADTGATFGGWSGGTGSASSCSGTGDCTFGITTDSGVTATFTLNTYTVTPSAGAGGSISPNTPQTVNHGSTTSFTVTPDTGYSASVGGTCGGTLVSNTYTTNPITGNCTVAATFALECSCIFMNTLSPTSASYPASGGSGTVLVDEPWCCCWSAQSNASWITVTRGASGCGNENATYSVAENTGTAHTGTITIAWQTFTVSQESGCSLTISPASTSYSSSGGTGSITVTSSDSSCSWTATSSADWITITSGANGTGSGTTEYGVAENTGIARTGTITIAGLTFTVNQHAGCSFIIAPATASYTASGGTGNVTITASDSACSWTAESSADWITITSGTSGNGSVTVSYVVEENPELSTRTGEITLAGQTHSVMQGGRSVSFEDVIGMYNDYLQCLCTWDDVITVYFTYVTAMDEGE